MSFLLVHGAFRGSWAWGDVPDLLRSQGQRVEVPTLLGMGELAAPPGRRPTLGLSDWVAQLAALCHLADLDDVVLVGHSQGGMVARAAAAALGDRLASIVYLDSPLPTRGQRGVDLSGPVDEERLPPADAWLEPQPLPVGGGYDEALCGHINPRLGPTPVGPSLEPMPDGEPTVARHVAFCSLTPDGFPSSLAREVMESAGEPYTLLESPHDVALARPTEVAEWLASTAPEPRGA